MVPRLPKLNGVSIQELKNFVSAIDGGLSKKTALLESLTRFRFKNL